MTNVAPPAIQVQDIQQNDKADQGHATNVAKNTTSKKRTHRRPTAPLGLRAVFGALQPFHFQGVYGWTTPEAFLDVYQAIERTNQETAQDAFTAALADAANREYPGSGFGPDGDQRASEHAETMGISAFWAGVATCWYVMTAINGKGES